MKIQKLEKWLLLEQSGELSPRKCRRLELELTRSPEARKLRRELRLINESICGADVELSPWMATRIHVQLRGEIESTAVFSGAWKPALALAACFVIALGFWNFQGKQAATSANVVQTASIEESAVWDDSLGDDLSELENLILALSDSSFDIMEM